jgi:hypothetical protein
LELLVAEGEGQGVVGNRRFFDLDYPDTTAMLG